MNATWTGVFPAVTTHLHEDPSLDLAATAQRWELLLESDASGLIVCGFLGENQNKRQRGQPTNKNADLNRRQFVRTTGEAAAAVVATSASAPAVLSGASPARARWDAARGKRSS